MAYDTKRRRIQLLPSLRRFVVGSTSERFQLQAQHVDTGAQLTVRQHLPPNVIIYALVMPTALAVAAASGLLHGPLQVVFASALLAGWRAQLWLVRRDDHIRVRRRLTRAAHTLPSS